MSADIIEHGLAGMCRAQGIAHQKVTAAGDLAGALHSAWALKRHSVLEVITGRDSNVDQHRQLQAAVQQAVHQAATILTLGKEVTLFALCKHSTCMTGPMASKSCLLPDA